MHNAQFKVKFSEVIHTGVLCWEQSQNLLQENTKHIARERKILQSNAKHFVREHYILRGYAKDIAWEHKKNYLTVTFVGLRSNQILKC